MSSNTVIAFDFGTKSIGVAVGQTITGTARPLAALKAREGIPDWELIAAVFREWQPDYVVVGLPLNMDGTPQLVTNQAKNSLTACTGVSESALNSMTSASAQWKPAPICLQTAATALSAKTKWIPPLP